jgi:hypothetical protein
MHPETENFYLKKEEPEKSCLLALRDIILRYDENMKETRKYGMPCFTYKGNAFCYLWIHKKYKQPYILMVEGGKIDHPALIQEERARMKIMLIDPEKDIPVDTIEEVFAIALEFY